MLDLGDSLQHVVKHLESEDCQRLRHTCTLLRRHAAVVQGISAVEEASEYLKGLQQLTGLCHLGLYDVTSIFHLHHLSGLSKLSSVVLEEMHVIDLTPLSVIPSLRRLELSVVEHYAGLSSLSQLHMLIFWNTAATHDVLQLSALTWLQLSEGSQAGGLGQLGHLRSLSVPWPKPWTADATEGLALAVAEGLPALCSLTCHFEHLPPLHSLTRLTALNIRQNCSELPDSLQDLRQLTGLVKLGLTHLIGQPQMRSYSVTAIFLPYSELYHQERIFACLAGCGRLKHIMLLGNIDVTTRFDRIPPRPMTLWLEQQQSDGVLLDSRAAEALHIRRVKKLTWDSDPVMLEADCH